MSLIWSEETCRRSAQGKELNEVLVRFCDAARDTRFWYAAKAQWMEDHPDAEPDHSAIARLADRLRSESMNHRITAS